MSIKMRLSSNFNQYLDTFDNRTKIVLVSQHSNYYLLIPTWILSAYMG